MLGVLLSFCYFFSLRLKTEKTHTNLPAFSPFLLVCFFPYIRSALFVRSQCHCGELPNRRSERNLVSSSGFNVSVPWMSLLSFAWTKSFWIVFHFFFPAQSFPLYSSSLWSPLYSSGFSSVTIPQRTELMVSMSGLVLFLHLYCYVRIFTSIDHFDC